MKNSSSDTFLVVNASLLKTREPGLTLLKVLRIKGSSRVPTPSKHFGSEVVCSGSASRKTACCRPKKLSSNKSNRISGMQQRK